MLNLGSYLSVKILLRQEMSLSILPSGLLGQTDNCSWKSDGMKATLMFQDEGKN